MFPDFLSASSLPHILFIPRAIRQANTVITIFGFTSTKSSGSAYTRAPIFLAMEMAYLPKAEHQSTGVEVIHNQVDQNLQDEAKVFAWVSISTNFALLSLSSSPRSSVFTRSYLMDPGWMESIRSRTGMLLLMDWS